MRASTKTILTFSVPLLVLGALYFALMYGLTRDRLVGVTAEEPLAVRHIDSDLPLDPLAEDWARIEPSTIHLWPQNARVPYGTEEREIAVRAAYNERDIAFLIQFADDTENRETAPAIPDACAVFFGPADAPATVQMMGQDASGNIWHWLADRDAQQHRAGSDSVLAVLELVTVGPGTQTPLEHQTVAAMGVFARGKWSVVFKRSLEGGQEDAVSFDAAAGLIVSFAVWDGALTESFAAKSISIVRPLVLTPK